MSDLIKRENVREALKDAVVGMGGDDFCEMGVHIDDIDSVVDAIPSADRPQGDVDAVDIFEREMHNLEQGYITLGEFDERIEPLRHLCYGRPQGEWIKHFDDLFPEDSTIECSVCHEYQPFEIDENYCPNCGARMKGAEDE